MSTTLGQNRTSRWIVTIVGVGVSPRYDGNSKYINVIIAAVPANVIHIGGAITRAAQVSGSCHNSILVLLLLVT